MNTVLWIFQGLLATVFIMAGMMKVISKKDVLKEKIGGWVEPFSESSLKLIGFLEVLGAFGLILPMLLDMHLYLTTLAAIGLSLTMIGAAYVHASRKETKEKVVNLVFLGLSVFVIYGRWYF